ncbi:MAG: hypothetical protein AB1Z98_29945 [Nannocystaceae bacterium]
MPPTSVGSIDTGDATDTGTATGDPTDPGATTADGTADDTGTTGEGVCEPTVVEILASTDPVGVVFLVDNTTGMAEEATEVSLRMNSFFNVLDAQLDTNIVVISTYPDDDLEGVCIVPPLGNGGCPSSDNNPPDLVHIDLAVTPLNAISHLFVTYDQWAGLLPPGARRHLVAISNGDTGVAAGDFDESFLMLDPEDNANYRFHASVAMTDCEEAETIGNNFAALASSTGGYVHDLCSQNYEMFFQALAGRIANDTGDRCRWEVPPPPPGVSFDPNNIELLLDVDGVMTSPGMVGSVEECNGVSTGWYWENPGAPNVMLACPETCTLLEEFDVVQSWVRFGCPE